MSGRAIITTPLLVAALGVAAIGCQTVVETDDETALDPLVLPSTTSTLPPTTTSLPPTTLPPTTLPPTTTSLPPTTLPPTTLPPTTLPPTTAAATTVAPTTTAALTTSAAPTTTAGATSPTTTDGSGFRDEPATGVLREGDRGQRTREVQRKLVSLGYLPTGGADGLFGPRTTAAVRAFQDDNDLEVDGLVGPDTQAALARAVDG